MHRQVILLLISIATLLTAGCQSTPILPDLTPVSQPKKADTIASHEFSLTAGQAMVGSLATIDSRKNDTLSDIARHFGLGYNDITLANADVDPWALPADQPILLPLQFILPDAPHKGIVLNIANMRLFYYPKSQPNTLLTYPVGIGRDGWNTPLGQTTIVDKKSNPVWTVPESIHREHQELGDPLPKVIHAGPDNPLGSYAMPLGFSNYLIHGTNKPYGIGMQVSHGCVQLYPEDIKTLFNKVKVGTPVRIVHQPYLAAWDQDMLYLEAHQPLEKWGAQNKQLKKNVRKKLKQLAAEKQASVDWDKVEDILKRTDGIPSPVLTQSPNLPELVTAAMPLEHPEQFYGQPDIPELSNTDWSILAGSFNDENEAQKLTAMLTHQGPPIPARKITNAGQFQVVAGPFKNKKEVKTITKRIKQKFDLEVTPLEPGAVLLN